jgi:hypothetical protein
MQHPSEHLSPLPRKGEERGKIVVGNLVRTPVRLPTIVFALVRALTRGKTIVGKLVGVPN